MKPRRIITALQASRSRKYHPSAGQPVASHPAAVSRRLIILTYSIFVLLVFILVILADCLAPDSSAQNELTPVPVFIKSRHR